MATPDELRQVGVGIVNGGVASAGADGKNVTAIDPMKALDVADKLIRIENDAAAASDGKRLGRILGNRMRFRNPGGIGPRCGE